MNVRSLLAVFALVAGTLAWGVSAARADAPADCPDPSSLSSYSGSDDAAAEVRELRRENAEECQAMVSAELSPVSLSDVDRTSFDSLGATTHGDAWFAIGVMCACLFGYFFLKAVIP